MNRSPHTLRRAAHQAGFTIVEVLISITIGLVILMAIGVVYQTSTNLQRQREDQDDVNEPVRTITNLLKYNISQAGYIDLLDRPAVGVDSKQNMYQAQPLVDPTFVRSANIYVRIPGIAASSPLASPMSRTVEGLHAVFGCGGAMNSTPNALAAATPPLTLGCGTASTTQHSLQVAYQAMPTSTNTSTIRSLPASNATTGEGRDCLQQDIAAGRGIVINRFYVAANPGDSVNELYCQGSGSATGQPLARGVEEFVVRYRVSAAGVAAQVASGVASNVVSAGGNTAQFLTAAQVSSDAVGWPGVTAVEVCLITATASTKPAAVGTVALQPTRPTCTRDSNGALNANIARAAGDLRLWKRSTFTLTVRNAIFSSPS